MTPWDTAQHMIRGRRSDGTPVDAGLVLAYLKREAALADCPVEELAQSRTALEGPPAGHEAVRLVAQRARKGDFVRVS